MNALETLLDVFPVQAGFASLELASLEPVEDDDREEDEDEDEDEDDEDEDASDEEDGGTRLTVRLVLWEPAGEDRQIRDIKEQQVYVGRLEDVDPARLAMAIDGWRMAVEQLFAQDSRDWLDSLMPSDLLRSFSELAALKRPRSAEDFAEALLASKQRLGRWLKD